jgi:DNA-binding MarR family transcriptional regulator
MVRRMEQAGFVVRKPDADDQRVSRVYLTPMGLQVRDSLQEAIGLMEHDIFEGFSTKEMDQLYGFMIRIRDNLTRTVGKKFHCDRD